MQLLFYFSNLHLNDNSKAQKHDHPDYDRLYKVHPMLDHLLLAFFIKFPTPTHNSIDEAMIGFKGRSMLKQYNVLETN